MFIGKRQITEVLMDGKFIDVTKPPYDHAFPSTSAPFKTDGSYYGSEYFDTCSGTYKTIGKTIICYAGGVEYNRYNVLSLSENERELNMSMEGNSQNKVKKTINSRNRKRATFCGSFCLETSVVHLETRESKFLSPKFYHLISIIQNKFNKIFPFYLRLEYFPFDNGVFSKIF